MTNDIKEILYLEKYIDKYKSDEESILNGNRLTTPAMLDYLEVKALLDYITNLQEENEQLRTDMNTYNNTIKEVNKECNSLFNHLTKKDLDYKTRNEKAVELLNEPQFEIDNIPCNYEKDIEKLRNILRGDE